MSELSHTVLPRSHVFLRSLLRRDRQLLVPDTDRRRRRRHGLSVVRLVAHLATTSLVFLALITLVWIVSWAFHFMHSVYPFSDEAFRLLDRLEILLLYADVVVSGIVLFFVIWNYIVEVIRGDS